MSDLPTAYPIQPSAPPLPPEGFPVIDEPYLLLEEQPLQNEPEPEPSGSSIVSKFLQFIGCFVFFYIIYSSFRHIIP